MADRLEFAARVRAANSACNIAKPISRNLGIRLAFKLILEARIWGGMLKLWEYCIYSRTSSERVIFQHSSSMCWWFHAHSSVSLCDSSLVLLFPITIGSCGAHVLLTVVKEAEIQKARSFWSGDRCHLRQGVSIQNHRLRSGEQNSTGPVKEIPPLAAPQWNWFEPILSHWSNPLYY